MEKSSKIYIAGHRGMVGSALTRMLRSRGYENIITRSHTELDLVNQADVENFFAKEKPEYVFLAAAKVGGILANDTYKAEFIYNNIMIAANIIHAAYRNGVNKLLNLGSSCIYPKFSEQPMKEEFLLTGVLEPTNEPYAIAKISAMKLCRYFNEQFNTIFMSAMPTNLYGPNDNYNLETSHVLPAFIRKFHLARLLKSNDFDSIRQDIKRFKLGFDLDEKLNFNDEQSICDALDRVGVTGEYVVLWGTGNVYRDFLYADDLAEACVFLMENCDQQILGEFVNIGTGEDIKIKDVADIIKEVVGFEGEIKRDLSKPDGTKRKLLDVSKISLIGWKARHSMEKGIKKSYDWYCHSTSFKREEENC